MRKFEDFEIWTTILDLAGKSKKDLAGVVGEELKNLLGKVDPRELLLKLLSQGTIEIDAKIRIVPNAKRPRKKSTRSEPSKTKKSASNK